MGGGHLCVGTLPMSYAEFVLTQKQVGNVAFFFEIYFLPLPCVLGALGTSSPSQCFLCEMESMGCCVPCCCFEQLCILCENISNVVEKGQTPPPLPTPLPPAAKKNNTLLFAVCTRGIPLLHPFFSSFFWRLFFGTKHLEAEDPTLSFFRSVHERHIRLTRFLFFFHPSTHCTRALQINPIFFWHIIFFSFDSPTTLKYHCPARTLLTAGNRHFLPTYATRVYPTPKPMGSLEVRVFFLPFVMVCC